MKRVSRRDLFGLGAAALVASGCARVATAIGGDSLPERMDLPNGDIHPAVRLANRAGFGPWPGQISDMEKMGLENWIEGQLHPTDDEPVAMSLQISRIEAARMDGNELRDEPEEEILHQLGQAALLRAVYSPWQLRERMVDFWSNHFNIYGKKGLGAYLKVNDDAKVVRSLALSTFPKLLRASAASPAMLAYLDNNVNEAGVPNENYARELMELHTLGIGGGYTQKDVAEVARCLTGWTVEDRFLHRRGTLRFDETKHDQGQKLVLGRVIPPGGGEKDLDQVLDILLKHPSTARFISKKLCNHFLGTTETPWLERTATTFEKTGGDITEMLRPILNSDELKEGAPIVKRPIDFMASSLRAFGAVTDGGKPLQRHLEAMGQPLFLWPMPDGYPDRTQAWTGSLLARWNFALALTGGEIGGTSIDLDKLDAKMHGLDIGSLALGTAAELAKRATHLTKREHVAALALCTPGFQWR